jgi:capsular polysaccharide transport system permease protein
LQPLSPGNLIHDLRVPDTQPRSLVEGRASPLAQRIVIAFPIASRAVRQLGTVQILFIVMVAIPTVLTALYSYLFMADRYVSEAHFIVRGVANQQATGLGALFRTFGISRAEDDSNAVLNFLQSRDAVHQLEARLPLRKMFSAPEADILSRFPHFWRNDSFESLFDYYLSRVNVIKLSSTGITAFAVTAFRAKDAQAIAENLLSCAEELVNRMNARAQHDALAYAQDALHRAEQRVVSAQVELAAFRNRELLIDPEHNSIKMLDVIGDLATSLAQTRTQLSETMASTPSSPMIESMKARIVALQNQIASEQQKLTGGNGALSNKISTYERLILDREFADRGLAFASTSFENARQEARRQQIYIETVVAPNDPDESTEPRRFRNIMTVFAFSFAVFGMIWFMSSAVKEHVYG